jgi:sulfate adenylyltransferase large subunit
MATGASTANLSIILIDARYGVLPQSRRHAYIAALLGIPHLVVAINKMDLVEFSEQTYNTIRETFSAFAAELTTGEITYIPISALEGDNVVTKSERTPWYTGLALLEHLETVPIARDYNLTDLRFPVQYVIRPNLDFRGFAGQIASGVIRRGDTVTVLPSGRSSRVKSIVTWEGDLAEAFAPMSVTVCLEDEVDISRGDMLALPDNLPHTGRRFDATVVWMNQKPLAPNRPYLIKQTTQVTQARIRKIRHRIDIHTLEHQQVGELELNGIGVVSIEAQRPLFFDPYLTNRATGSFILIDPITNETLGAGMILEPHSGSGGTGRVTDAERRSARGHAPLAICLPQGNTELPWLLERLLFDHGYAVHVIQMPGDLGEAIRTTLAAGLIAIVQPASEQQSQLVRDSVPLSLRYFSTASDPEEIWSDLESSGRLGHSPDPLTDGAGI